MYWVRSDPCGLFSANFTVLLILYALFVVLKILLLPWYGFCFHVVIYTCCSILALISHTRAQFSDPGAVPINHTSKAYPFAVVDSSSTSPPAHNTSTNTTTTQSQTARVCRRCKTVKPYRAHHCSTCARCIIRMDHHCPWVNNCVALFNQKYFVLFLFYTACCCVYSGVLLIARFISCTNNIRQCTITGVQVALCVVTFIEALIFGLFVFIMMFDQFSAIFDNTPGIDALQNKHGQKRGRYASLKEVFGEKFSWRWFLPLKLPSKVYEDFQSELLVDDVLTTATNPSQIAPPQPKETPKQV